LVDFEKKTLKTKYQEKHSHYYYFFLTRKQAFFFFDWKKIRVNGNMSEPTF